ncbi:hypothetical protein B296_00006521 [Ensete ventricosum]|uniref:G-patch domain-containing protein n=1 Tax=Ensete ventricosum TaxID=4639 RepID=A0A427AZB5_ENSVE|nr:hypothetical protein B296_00006521 [Ensete ventricosum]
MLMARSGWGYGKGVGLHKKGEASMAEEEDTSDRRGEKWARRSGWAASVEEGTTSSAAAEEGATTSAAAEEGVARSNKGWSMIADEGHQRPRLVEEEIGAEERQ